MGSVRLVAASCRAYSHGSFDQVTAVEANPAAARELASPRSSDSGGQHRAVAAVIVDFLREAVLQREHPDLIVLDPPRAGAGIKVCQLIAKVAPPQIVYVSCDPVTLGRDLLRILAAGRI